MKNYFDNVRIVPKYTINRITGTQGLEILTQYRCEKCGNWFFKSQIENYQIPVTVAGIPEIQKSTFICSKCYKEDEHSEIS